MSAIVSTYNTIEAPVEGDFRDRGSKFLAYAYPIIDKEDVKPIIQELKKMHPKAVHHCYAYRIGVDGLEYRAVDDGEPSGSAGKPILGQIDSAGLTNVLVVVVRYFGGTLLGVPGLINAYKTATALAFEQAKVITKNIEKTFTLSFDYNLLGEVMSMAKQLDANIVHQDMALFCKIKFAVTIDKYDTTIQKYSDMYQVTILD